MGLMDWFRREETNVIDYATAEDAAKIPLGFFRVVLPGGKKTRGLNHRVFGLCWDASDAALLKAGIQPPTDEELAKCPLVHKKASPISQRDGIIQLPNGGQVLQVGDWGDNPNDWREGVDFIGWNGREPSSGVQWS